MHYIRMKQLPSVVGMSRSKIYDLISKGEFIPAAKLSERCVGYRSDLVEDWIRSRQFTDNHRSGVAA